MSKTISNSDDVIDSRDVIERIAELEQQESPDEGDEHTPLDDEERAELDSLRKLADEASGCAPDWQYGECLIRDSYFKDYAQQLADDLGAVDLQAAWPCNCIDWDRAARELQRDYTGVDFDGVTYWIR